MCSLGLRWMRLMTRKGSKFSYLISVRLQAKDLPELSERLPHLNICFIRIFEVILESNLPSMMNGSSPA